MGPVQQSTMIQENSQIALVWGHYSHSFGYLWSPTVIGHSALGQFQARCHSVRYDVPSNTSLYSWRQVCPWHRVCLCYGSQVPWSLGRPHSIACLVCSALRWEPVVRLWSFPQSCFHREPFPESLVISGRWRLQFGRVISLWSHCSECLLGRAPGRSICDALS